LPSQLIGTHTIEASAAADAHAHASIDHERLPFSTSHTMNARVHHRSQSARRFTLMLLLATLTGCGPEPRVSGPAERLVLVPLKTGQERPAPRIVQRYEPGVQPDEWRVSAGVAHTQGFDTQDGGRVKMYIAVDPKQRVFRVSGRFDVSEITEINIAAHCGGAQNVTVSFWRGEHRIVQSRAIDLIPQIQPQGVLVRATWAQPDAPQCDTMEVAFRGAETRVGLLSVVVGARSPSAFASEDGGEQLWIGARGESRIVQWASSVAPLEARFTRGSDSDLSFCYGVPPAARTPKDSTALRLIVTSASGARVEERFSLEYGADESSWRDARIDLPGREGEELVARFELDAPKGVDAACAIADAWTLEGGASPRPSVLFITTDTVRADHIAAQGMGVEIDTPAIDALAGRGVLFRDCWSSTNTTNPSHGAMFTGLSPRDTGIMDQQTPLADAAKTLAEHYRAQGYSTWAAISARHLGPATSGLGQGFDRFAWPHDAWERRADTTLAFAREWLKTADGKPVFLWLHVFDAHFPYAPHPKFDRRYFPSSKPFSSPLRLPPAMSKSPEHSKLKDLEFERAQYRAEISYLDSELSPFLELARFRDGVVALVADHGESLGEQNVLFDHADLNPSTLHVPLILSWPGGPRGVRTDAPVMSTDVARTLLAVSGLNPRDFPGTDLRQVIDAPLKDTPRFAVAASRAQASLTMGKWHLVLHLNDHFEPPLYEARRKHQVELYDIAADRSCNVDLAEREPEVAKRLRAGLITWLKDFRGSNLAGDRSENSELLGGLATLGYLAATSAADDPLWEDDDCEFCGRYR